MTNGTQLAENILKTLLIFSDAAFFAIKKLRKIKYLIFQRYDIRNV